MAAPASFAAALISYVVLPFFFNPLREQSTYWGSEFLFLSIGYVLGGPRPDELKFTFEFGLPVVAAVAGVILWVRAGRGAAAARFVCAAAAFAALTLGYQQHPGDWLVGFYAADAALAVATIASAAAFVRRPASRIADR